MRASEAINEDPIHDIRCAVARAMELLGKRGDPKPLIDATVDNLPEFFRQPLVTAERVEELEREVEQIGKEKSRLNELITQDDDLEWEHIYHEFSLWQKIVGDHEAESHYWYTADGGIEILDSPEEVVQRRKEAAKRLVELESQIATLTAELEKARSGEAWVGNEIWNDCRLPTAPLPPAEPTPTPAPAKPEWLAKVRRKLESIDGILGGAKASIADAARELDYLKSELAASLAQE